MPSPTEKRPIGRPKRSGKPTEKEKRPVGRPKGSGRPIKKPEEKLITVGLTIRPNQRQKLDTLGGSSWLREKIDQAL